MRGDGRSPEAYRGYVERFARVEDIYPSQELRKGRELVYVAILTLNPRFVDAKVLAASVTEPRPIASGDFVLIRGAGGDPWLRIEGQNVLADRGSDGASTWVFGKRGGARGPLQSGDQVVLRGIWGDPYVTVEPDGRLVAFRGPSEATVFRLDKRGAAPGTSSARVTPSRSSSRAPAGSCAPIARPSPSVRQATRGRSGSPRCSSLGWERRTDRTRGARPRSPRRDDTPRTAHDCMPSRSAAARRRS